LVHLRLLDRVGLNRIWWLHRAWRRGGASDPFRVAWRANDRARCRPWRKRTATWREHLRWNTYGAPVGITSTW